MSKNNSLKSVKKIQEKYADEIKNYVNGKFVATAAKITQDVFSPLNGEKITKVFMSDIIDLENLVKSISAPQKKWSELTLKKRADIVYNYKNLLIKHKDEMAEIIHVENGKCIIDANAEISKAIETVEFSCSMPNVVNNRIQEVSNGVWAMEEYKPIGIVSCITPFNFPIMVPHWTIAQAIVMGNAVVLKPSEQTPIASNFIADLWKKAGLPDGVFNVFNGGTKAVEALCDNPDIKAISFVGSSKVAEIVYKRGCANGKRVLALGGAKNFILVSQTVEPKEIIRDLISSAYGMVGQRCMAASVIVTIGPNQKLIDELKNNLSKMTLGPDVDFTDGLSPVVNKENIEKIKSYIDTAKKAGANILVDGTKFSVNDNEFKNGYYIGPTLIDWSGHENDIPDEEIFGPVLEIIQAKDEDHAIQLQNKSKYGNAASIFTMSGREAFELTKRLQAGMLGVNIGVPVPREPMSFGGIKYSKFGHGDITGHSANELWANIIKTTMKWNVTAKKDWLS